MCPSGLLQPQLVDLAGRGRRQGHLDDGLPQAGRAHDGGRPVGVAAGVAGLQHLLLEADDRRPRRCRCPTGATRPRRRRPRPRRRLRPPSAPPGCGEAVRRSRRVAQLVRPGDRARGRSATGAGAAGGPGRAGPVRRRAARPARRRPAAAAGPSAMSRISAAFSEAGGGVSARAATEAAAPRRLSTSARHSAQVARCSSNRARSASSTASTA